MPGIKITLEANPVTGAGDAELYHDDDTSMCWTPFGTAADGDNTFQQAANVLAVGDYVAGGRYASPMKIKTIESWTP